MTRKTLVSKSQREQLINLPHDLTFEQAESFYSFNDDEISFIKSHRGDHNRLGLALQLCYFKYPGRIWRLDDIYPASILDFICQELLIKQQSLKDYAKGREGTRRRHVNEICSKFSYRIFSEDYHTELSGPLMKEALQTGNGFALLSCLLSKLREYKIVYNSISTVESFGRDILDSAQKQLYEHLTCSLSLSQERKLDSILDLRETRLSHLSWLKKYKVRSSSKGLHKLLDRLDWIKSFDLPSEIKNGIYCSRLYQFGREGSSYKTNQLDRFDSLRRHALMVAFLLNMEEEITDYSIELYDKLVGQQFKKVEKKHFDQFQKDSKAINESLKNYTKVGKALLKARKEESDLDNAVEATIGWDNLAVSVDHAEALTQKDDFDVISGLDNRYSEIRKFVPRYFETLEFNATNVTHSLSNAIDLLNDLNEKGTRKIPENAPTDFIKSRWNKYVYQNGQINRHYYEWSVVAELRNAIRSGDMSVPSSRNYRDFNSYQISLDEFEKKFKQKTLPLAINFDFDEYIADRQKKLGEEFNEVLPLLVKGDLDGVSLEEGVLSISPLESIVPEEAQKLSDRLYNMLPKVKLTDILVEVNSWVGFEKCFTHLYNGNEVSDTRLLLTSILGDGINMSQARMADATPEISRSRLINISKWYIREETYAKAIAEVTNMQYNHPFSSHWGDGTTSSSDAQNYPIKDPKAKVGDVNIKYGNKATLNYYTHLSDQYAPFFTNIIRSTVRDSPYVLDGLLYHESDLEIEEHHTDTGGFSDQVFGLCHLLGFRFSPRIRDLHDLKLFHFGEKKDYPDLDQLMGDKINEDRLSVHWKEILRVAASIRLGTVSASTMLKKLGSYPRQNSLGWALREIGRIERTLFILNWIKDPQLRRKTTLALNKGEGRNTLARDVHHSGLGKIQDHSWERQIHRASGLCLVTGCIILWNTVYLAKAVETLRAKGEDIPEEYLQHISPVGWEHINLGGEFFWDMAQKTTLDNLRPLRN